MCIVTYRLQLFPEDKNVELPLPVLFELFTTENLTKSEKTFLDLQLAIGAILDFKNKISINHFTPVEFLIKIHYPEYLADSNVGFYLNEFIALGELDFEDCNNVDLSHHRNLISSTTDFYNTVSAKYREEIKRVGKSNFQKWDTLENTQRIIIDLMNLEIESQNLELPKILDFDFSKAELFIRVFDKQLRDLAITGERMRDNDWNDIFLLAYVKPNSKYWTFEKKWNRKISELGFDKYLVNNKGSQ